VPVKVSKDNSLSNLVSVCNSCHRRLESIGLKILQEGGSRSDVRKVELTMIMESKKKRMQKYLERIKNDGDGKENIDVISDNIRREQENIQENKEN